MRISEIKNDFDRLPLLLGVHSYQRRNGSW